MDSSKLGSWLQVLANSGLIAGLVLVAVQIKQNTDIATAQMLHDGWLGSISTQLVNAGEHPAKSIALAQTNPSALTQEDLIVLDAWLTAQWLHAMRLEDLASHSYELFAAEEMSNSIAFGSLGNPFALTWWDHRQRMGGASVAQTRDAVNRILAERGDEHVRAEMTRLTSIKAEAVDRHRALNPRAE